MAMDDPREKVAWLRPSDFGGWEYLIADQSRHLWTVYHDTYTVCSCVNWDHEWAYRGGRHILRGPGSMLMEPGELHRTFLVPPIAKFKVATIPVEDVRAAAVEWGMAGVPHLREAKTEDPVLSLAVWRLGQAAEAAVRPPPLALESMKAEVVRLLLGQCERASDSAKHRDEPGAVARAKFFLNDRPDVRVTLDELAAASGLSRYRLAHVFARTTGLSPHAYHLRVRVRRACALLRAGMAGADVAIALGFVDQAHFTRHFKRVMQVTPAAYARLT